MSGAADSNANSSKSGPILTTRQSVSLTSYTKLCSGAFSNTSIMHPCASSRGGEEEEEKEEEKSSGLGAEWTGRRSVASPAWAHWVLPP